MVPRLDADALVDALALLLPAGGRSRTPTSSTRTAGGAARSRSTSCSTPVSSTRTATGTSRSTTPRPTSTTCACASRSRNAGPERGDAACAADALVSQHMALGARRAQAGLRVTGRGSSAETPPAASAGWSSPGTASRGRSSATTRRTPGASRGCRRLPAYPKDAINDHVVAGAPTVEPRPGRHQGRALVPARRSRPARRPSPAAAPSRPGRGRTSSAGFDDIMARRERGGGRVLRRHNAGADADEARSCARRSPGCCGPSSSTTTTLPAGSTATPASPRRRPSAGRPQRALAPPPNPDVMSMPDTWEYPWYAAWDLAFHCVALAHVDPAFAKDQLHADVSGVVHAPQRPAARLRVGLRRREPSGPRLGGAQGLRASTAAATATSCGGSSTSCCINFTWWVNRKDAEGNNLFEGGFLGMDNIGPIDRSARSRAGVSLEQADGTALDGHVLPQHAGDRAGAGRARPTATGTSAMKFLEHFTYVATAINDHGLWDEDDGFFYDVLALVRRRRDPHQRPLHGRGGAALRDRRRPAAPRRGLRTFPGRVEGFLSARPEFAGVLHFGSGRPGAAAILGPEGLRSVLARLLDEAELLSPHGFRSISAAHREQPIEIGFEGRSFAGRLRAGGVDHRSLRRELQLARAHLVPGQLPGHRGPALLRLAFGDDIAVQYPARSGQRPRSPGRRDVGAVGQHLPRRRKGRRPVLRRPLEVPDRPGLARMIPFHEYFHGDSGAGLGASHQTGWTGLVADIIVRLSDARDVKAP